MRTVFIILASAALSILATMFFLRGQGPADTKAETAFDRVMRTGVIRCGYYVFPPVTYRDPNTKELSGFSVDMMEEIAKRAGLKVEWTEEVNFSNWTASLQANRFDVACTPQWPEVQLGRVVLFSEPMMYAGMYPLIRADDEKLLRASLAEFNKPDVRFVVQDGNGTDELTRRAFPNATINAMPSTMDGPSVLEEIVTRKSDVILLDKNAEVMYNKNNPGTFKLRDDLPPSKAQAFTFAFELQEIELKLFFDNAIRELINSGEINRMLDKWEEEKGTFIRPAILHKE